MIDHSISLIFISFLVIIPSHQPIIFNQFWNDKISSVQRPLQIAFWTSIRRFRKWNFVMNFEKNFKYISSFCVDLTWKREKRELWDRVGVSCSKKSKNRKKRKTFFRWCFFSLFYICVIQKMLLKTQILLWRIENSNLFLEIYQWVESRRICGKSQICRFFSFFEWKVSYRK